MSRKKGKTRNHPAGVRRSRKGLQEKKDRKAPQLSKQQQKERTKYISSAMVGAGLVGITSTVPF